MKFIVQLYICLFQYFEDFNSSFNSQCRLPSPNDNSQNGGCPIGASPIVEGTKKEWSFFPVEQTNVDP